MTAAPTLLDGQNRVAFVTGASGGIGAALAMALALVSTPGPASAFDPLGAELIGLRLGMSEADVKNSLLRQGFATTTAADGINAQTKDGRIFVALSQSHRAIRIRYVFNNREPGQPDHIWESIRTRFGDPDQNQPRTWCLAVDRDGRCPSNQALLIYLPDVLTLSLTMPAPINGHP